MSGKCYESLINDSSLSDKAEKGNAEVPKTWGFNPVFLISPFSTSHPLGMSIDTMGTLVLAKVCRKRGIRASSISE